MVKRDITQLAVYQIEDVVDILPLRCLRTLYLERTSEIIYITQDAQLYGIVCLGDVRCHSRTGEVRINKVFTRMIGYNVIKAHEIFREKANVHKVPVVNEQGELIGDYSRWDDMLYIERNQAQLMQKEAVKKALEFYEAVYVIEPIEKKHSVYLQLIGYLEYFQLEYTVLKKEQIGDKLRENAIGIFLDEDERKGMQCFYGMELYTDGRKLNTCWKMKFFTYKNLLLQIMGETQLERLGIKKSAHLLFSKVDDKATILLSALQEKGVKCFCMWPDEHELTEYGRNFGYEVYERLKKNPINQERVYPRKTENKEFFAELYEQEDYENEIAQKEIASGTHTLDYILDITGKYFNAKYGSRATCFQPKRYIGTIYMLGPCMTIGSFVEDQYTIESYLQKQLLEKGYIYRVENKGAMLRPDSQIDIKLAEVEQYHANDIVIYQSRIGEAVGIEGGNSLEKIFEEHQIPSVWVTDMYFHCNHKANQLIAESILEMIEPCLSNERDEDNDIEGVKIDFDIVMKDYIQHKYLDQYFSHFSGEKYSTIGAVVMNCNPFSKGHRYLIEQASQQVEFLIVFAVEEDESLFPFEERIKLIEEGTKDLRNIMVVPSGDFILSRNTFYEYFWKEENEKAVCNATYDINVFANYIAKPLHITHRFAGEEPEDALTRIYNETMKKVLPQKGIAFIEIPRIELGEEIVSASKIRKYLKNEEYDKAFALLPKTTMQYLMKQI